MEGDLDLNFLLRGGDLLKVRSLKWRKTRYFKLEEDCKTVWHESKKLFKTHQTCECCPAKTRQKACVRGSPEIPHFTFFTYKTITLISIAGLRVVWEHSL